MLTCEAGRYEYACEATEATYKGRTIHAPIFGTDILVFAVCFGSSFIGSGELWGWLQNLVGVSNQVRSLHNLPLRAPLDIDSGLTLSLPRLNVLTVSLDCMVIYWNRIVAFSESMAASRQAAV